MESIKDISDIVGLIKLLVGMVVGLCTFVAVASYKVRGKLGKIESTERDVILINKRIDGSDSRHDVNEANIRVLQDTGIHTKNSIENIDKTLESLSDNLTGWQGRSEKTHIKSSDIIETLMKKIPDVSE